MTALFHTAGQILAGIELLTDLSLAAVALMALGRLADLIKLIYAAGRLTGHAWFTYAVPAILWTADQISYVNSLIDWGFVLTTVVDCLKVIASAIGAGVLWLWAIRCDYIRRNTTPIEPTATPVVALVATPAAPAAIAPTQPTATVKQLRRQAREAGIPSKHWKSAKKHELIALLAA